MAVGCASQKVNGVETPLTPEQAARLGCRPGDTIDRTLVADTSAPANFTHDGRTYTARSSRTFRNTNTAWWDASQIYGYDETSHIRVKRDPKDPARLLMVQLPGAHQRGRSSGLPPAPARFRPEAPRVDGPGVRSVPRQLDRRDELSPYGVLARAQPVRRRVPPPRGEDTRRGFGAAQSRCSRACDPIPGRHTRRTVRGREARRLGRDRQDSHDRMDAPAALRRAALQGHERQLERPLQQGHRS